MRHRYFIGLATMLLVGAACGGTADTTTTTVATTPTTVTTVATTATTVAQTTTTEAPTTTTVPEGHDGEMRTLEAVSAEITVDGDSAEWADIEGLELMLEPIEGESAEERSAMVKVAHDGEFLYLLFTVEDDYDWVADDGHLSASAAVLWAIEEAAGPHMGTEAEDGEGPSLGLTDIWHWELECGPGVESGGSVAGPGDGDPGNDSGCNFDDEWATDPETREDDVATGAENSLLGVFHHTSETNGEAGTWTFEMRRPLETGDEQDIQFSVGGTALMALAYWDADNSPEGWDDAQHVQSANKGWIELTLAG